MDCEKIIQLILAANWIDSFAALSTPAIAFIVAVISFKEWLIRRARLKHELFDRRYNQFSIIKEFLGSIISSGKVTSDEKYNFLVGIRGARFLFNKSIAEYIDKNIWKLAVDLWALAAELQGLPEKEERTKNVRRQAFIKKQLYKELKDLEDRFVPYLQINNL